MDIKKPTKAAKGVFRGNKRQITLGLSPELLEKIDEAAESENLSRAAWINMTITRALKLAA